MSSHSPHTNGEAEQEEEDDVMLDPAEAEEEVPQGEDAAMDSDEEAGELSEEIQLQNDSVAHFDAHKDSIFCIAQHPTNPAWIATGAGDDAAYIWDCTPPDAPVLPPSYQSDPQPVERESLKPLARLDGHTESLNAIAFTLPHGEYVVTGDLDGRLSIYAFANASTAAEPVASVQEVEEVQWIQPCPHPSHPNTFALGANDGSVWVYSVNASDPSSPLSITQAYYLHTGPCTAGTWSADGKLLATVSEDSSLYVWDVFGEAGALGLASSSSVSGGQAVVGLTAQDERFNVEGGLYSVAISPGGAVAAVGGAGGQIRIVGLPRLSTAANASATSGSKGAGARGKAGGGKQTGAAKAGASTAASSGQAGVILASLGAQSDGVETLSFSSPPLTLLAAGSVDGSIALYDVAHNFAVRRHIKEAHEEEAVIRVEFVPGTTLLTSCGNDGVVRRWDARGGTAAAHQGLVGEWRGHRGGGEGGGVLGFVQAGGGRYIVTAGDE
ncbi:hypothetical protein LTR28_005952 [Elasticomyces elasticus]|nr:hypothetical protein LTR28_005952 [Elasticomyces elasticus]